MDELARLREYYHPMSDDELLMLERDMKDLTPTAQQVLTEELQVRGIGKGAGAKVERPGSDGVVIGAGAGAMPVYDDRNQFVDGKGQVFTYKTLLTECDEREQAWQLQELLKRNGIDCWVELPKTGAGSGLPSRLEVGADQLEQAKLIIQQPMPQEIVAMFDEIAEEVDEYEPPKCPQCGDEDPVLENTEPANQWLCESCGHTWSEAAPKP